MKEWVKEDGFITRCPKNISQMNIWESIWYHPETYGFFGKYYKSNIGWLILYLWCPWISELYYIFKKEGILNISVLDFIMTMLVIIATLFFLGPIFCLIIEYFNIKSAKEQMEIFRKNNKN